MIVVHLSHRLYIKMDVVKWASPFPFGVRTFQIGSAGVDFHGLEANPAMKQMLAYWEHWAVWAQCLLLTVIVLLLAALPKLCGHDHDQDLLKYCENSLTQWESQSRGE